MRSRTAEWFETKVGYDKMQEDGREKNVKELYAVDALSFSETEASITEEMSSYISGEFSIKSISPASYKEVFFSDVDTDDKWYKAKLKFITLDEKTGKEKTSNVYYLVQANSLQTAVKYIDDFMGHGMQDYAIASVSETMILDVFEHTKALKKAEPDDKPEYEQAEKKAE